MPDFLPIPQQAVAPTVPRAVARAIDIERGRAAVTAARVDGVAFVAGVALHRVAELSDLEARMIRLSPLAEPRLRVIGDCAAASILGVIQRHSTWM